MRRVVLPLGAVRLLIASLRMGVRYSPQSENSAVANGSCLLIRGAEAYDSLHAWTARLHGT